MSSWRRSSLCTSGLFFLAADAGARPWNRGQPRLRDRLAAVAADSVAAVVDASQRAVDGLQDLGVGLFQFELDVYFVVPARLIGHVALAPGIVFHRPLQRPGGAAQQLRALVQQRVTVDLKVHRLRLLLGTGQHAILARYSARNVASGLCRSTS